MKRQYPLKSTVLNSCRVLPLETLMRLGSIDIELKGITQFVKLYSTNIISTAMGLFVDYLLFGEFTAFRKNYRWKLIYRNIDYPKKNSLLKINLVKNGVYLITGGLGGIGLTVANWLSTQEPSITLVLISRTAFPRSNRMGNLGEKKGS